eukprot:g43095.t1
MKWDAEDEDDSMMIASEIIKYRIEGSGSADNGILVQGQEIDGDAKNAINAGEDGLIPSDPDDDDYVFQISGQISD